MKVTFCAPPRRGIVQLVGRVPHSQRRDAHHTLLGGHDWRTFDFGRQGENAVRAVFNPGERLRAIELEAAGGGQLSVGQ